MEYLVGTMIELPRACLTAAAIAEHADFFSFGTNDLTQTTFGYSRDAARFLLPLALQPLYDARAQDALVKEAAACVGVARPGVAV